MEKRHVRWFPKSKISHDTYDGPTVEFRAEEWMFEDEDWYTSIPSRPAPNTGGLTGTPSLGGRASSVEYFDDMDDDIPF